jgi:hypothetical protein
MKIFVIVVTLILMGSNNCCPINKLKSMKLSLPLNSCVLLDGQYRYLKIELPNKADRTFNESEGNCEYRFQFSDSSVFYVSTNIWMGSVINAKNRKSADLAYIVHEKFLDTLKFSGQQDNGRFWFEHYRGNLVFGGINIDSTKVHQMMKVAYSAKFIE